MDNKEAKDILMKTMQIFFKYGVRSITMDDIANQLGISKKTLYNHFENKADLIEKIMLMHLEDEKYACKAIVQDDTNAIDQLIQIYQFNLNNVRNINHTLIFELKKYYGNVWQLFDQHKWDFVQKSILDNILLGQKQGLFRLDLNPTIISKLYTNRIDMIIDGDIFPITEFSFKELITELFVYHIRGIVTHKGLEYLESINLNF